MRHDHPAVGVLALGLARRLGLPDTALLPGDAPAAGAEPRRIEVVRPDMAEAEVLALPWATVVAGPAWFTRACRGVPAEALGVESALLRTAVRAAAGEAVRSRGEFTLYTPEARAAARPVGTVTAAAQHHEAGAVALALLKRTVPVDAELLVREDAPGEDGAAEGGWIAASQEPLVSPDAGQVVGRPRGVGRLR